MLKSSPVPIDNGGHKLDPEMDRLSNILQEFNDLFGNIDWTSRDKIEKAIAEELIPQVEGDETYQNAVVKSDKQNARIEHDKTFRTGCSRVAHRLHRAVQTVQRQ